MSDTRHDPRLQPGDKVLIVGSTWFDDDEVCTGVVIELYPGYSDVGDPLAYPERWAASVKPDVLPARWPYSRTDNFGPDVSQLRLLAKDTA